MDDSGVSRWFAEYLEIFGACGRGELDAASVLAYLGAPLLITTDDGLFALTSDDQIVVWAQQQFDGMRSTDYHHSEASNAEVTVLNAASALYRATPFHGHSCGRRRRLRTRR